jgi:hypothetical protein
MMRVSPYLKMRVLGAIEFAPGDTARQRIKHVSQIVFTDDDNQRRQFTWRTIETWHTRYNKDGTRLGSDILGMAGLRWVLPWFAPGRSPKIRAISPYPTGSGLSCTRLTSPCR